MAEEFDKLVRDRVPEVIEDDGDRPVTHVATGAEYRRRISGGTRTPRPNRSTGESRSVCPGSCPGPILSDTSM
jgi:hypothetical protein